MLPTPQPEYRRHQTVATGQFAPGATITLGGSIRTIIPIASAGRFRFRFKCSVAGSLTGKFLRPSIEDGKTASFEEDEAGDYASAEVGATGHPDAVVVVADTEALLEVTDLCGESYILVTFTEEGSAAGTVTYANSCQL